MPYIGTQPKDVRSFGRAKFDFTATQGQTAFTGADDDSKTLGFTDGQIEVYVNGILMDESDFTTSNGNTVTLASAANLNDIISIVALQTDIPNSDYVPASGGTFSGNVTHNGNVGIGTDSASDHLEIKTANPALKITDTANSNNNIRISQGTNSYITASNNFYMGVNGNSDVFNIIDDDVLVGKTAADGSTAGHELRTGSFAIHTRISNPSLYARRMTDDGPVMMIQDNNGDVGKIGTQSGDITIDGPSEHTGLRFEASDITPRHNGAASNNYTSLGTASNRFKDVHVGNAVKTSAAQFNSAGTYTPDPFTNRNDNYFESYRTCLGFFAPGAGQNYIHLKTNLPDNGNKMIKFEWNGFTYSGVNSHNSVTFYTYSGTNSPYNPIYQSWGNGHGIVNLYYSSDNYVVVVCQASGSYTGGFLYVQSGRSHIWYSPDITTASNSNATSGVY